MIRADILIWQRGKNERFCHCHHKLPLAEGGTHDEGNLVSLCQPCHARIHAERGDRWQKK